MNGNQETALSTVMAEAKQRALKVIEANPGCVSYVKPEDLETQSLFIPVVSVIKPTAGEFHEFIPGIGIMAKVPLMNTIREKAGVNIHRTETMKRSEYIWVAHCYGDKRQPDGTMLAGDASYEFDAEKRAELDFINDKKSLYTTDVAKRKHVLELCKFGEQKAVTGAQLALIHKLAKIPPSFKTPEELMKGMIVCRIDRNVDGIMNDPQMRKAAVAMAVGATDQIFGPAPQKAIEADAGVEISAEEVHEPPADDDPFDEKEAAAAQMSPEEEARLNLEEWANSDIPSGAVKARIQELVTNKEATLEYLQAVLQLLGWLEKDRLKASARDVVAAMLVDRKATLQAMQDLLKRCTAFDERRKAKTAASAAGGAA